MGSSGGANLRFSGPQPKLQELVIQAVHDVLRLVRVTRVSWCWDEFWLENLLAISAQAFGLVSLFKGCRT